MRAIWCLWHENWTLFTSDCCLRNRNNSNSKTNAPIFIFVIEDKYVLLIRGLSYSFNSFFFRHFTFSVIHSLYFITHVILNCHCQWLVYKQKNINTHGEAKRDFNINTRRNFQSFSFISERSCLSSLLICMTLPLSTSSNFAFQFLLTWSLRPNQKHWIFGELYGTVYGAQYRKFERGSKEKCIHIDTYTIHKTLKSCLCGKLKW